MIKKRPSKADVGSMSRVLERQGLGVLHRLYDGLDELPTALARIAKYIVENPEKVVRQSVSELGEFSGSGEASIIRLCRQMGFSGFREFKLVLAAELGNPSLTSDAHAASGDNGIELLHASFGRAIDIIHRRFESADYERAADLLAAARRVDIFGASVSGIIGELLSYRLLRLGIPAQAFRDGNLALEVANGLGTNCLAIAFSESGLTTDTVKFLKFARLTGAQTIAFTNRPKSPVADTADIALHTASVGANLTVAGSIGAVPGMVFAIEALTLHLIRLRGT